jgi:hypothetical protein
LANQPEKRKKVFQGHIGLPKHEHVVLFEPAEGAFDVVPDTGVEEQNVNEQEIEEEHKFGECDPGKKEIKGRHLQARPEWVRGVFCIIHATSSPTASMAYQEDILGTDLLTHKKGRAE